MTNAFDNQNLRLKFDGSAKLVRNYSQAGQDLFVLSVLDGKRDGVFLDLGCHQPIAINNTFLLESEFGWNGLSFDIDESCVPLWVFRRTKMRLADCTKLNWDEVIESLGTRKIDYLSIDLEPPSVTLECLKSIPFERLDVAAVTFEHDVYRAGETVRPASRELFEKYGFVRCCSDIKLNGYVFEDWYCNPKFVDIERINAIAAEDEEWEKIVFERSA